MVKERKKERRKRKKKGKKRWKRKTSGANPANTLGMHRSTHTQSDWYT